MAPEQDERDALARIIESLKWETFTAGDGELALRRVPSEKVADAILAAGFHRQVQITEATVDAAARAMAERFGDPPYLPWEDWGPLSQDEFRADARAALEAAEEVRRG